MTYLTLIGCKLYPDIRILYSRRIYLKKTLILLSILTLVPALSFAAAKKKNNLQFYVEKVSQLTGKRYLSDKRLKGNLVITKNFELNQDNADKFISKVLFLNGYTRVPSENGDGFMIINSRDVRYTPVPQYFADKNTSPDLPDNYDYYQLTYEAEGARAMTNFARSFRPFMSRYGRIINLKHNNLVIIQDTAPNLKRFYKLLAKFDTPINPELQKVLDQEDVRNFELKKIQAQYKETCGHEKNKGVNKRKK